jgi:hypothetical protein
MRGRRISTAVGMRERPGGEITPARADMEDSIPTPASCARADQAASANQAPRPLL